MSQDPQPASVPWLIVGLGNIGPRYAGTRHNIGFMAVEEFAKRHGLRFSSKQGNAEIAQGNIAGVRVVLAKPQTYMNESGRAVGSVSRFYKIPAERVLVIYDEIDLPLGTLRLREKGSANGHNGLKSIIQHLGTQSFPRLRIGVGRPVIAGYSEIDWVLGRFAKDEQPIVEETLLRAVDAVEAALQGGLERAMNRYNTKEDQPKTSKTSRAHQKEAPAEQEMRTTKEAVDQPKSHEREGWAAGVRRILEEEAKGK